MPKVTYIQEETGDALDVEAEEGLTYMEVAKDHDVPGIEGECGGACACATCHVYVDENFLDRLEPPTEEEESMLDFAFNVRFNSRLACQIHVEDDLDNLVLFVPKSF